MKSQRIKTSEAQKIVNQFSKDAKFYWIDAMVKLGDITKAQGGFLVYINNL